MTERAYLLLGSNEGERERYLHLAAQALAEAASGPLQFSGIYETAAWGLEAQPAFLNMAVAFDTLLSPEALLQLIGEIEATYGRQRDVVWGQRTIDIDILLFGSRQIQTPKLHIPHPRLAQRRFALVPLAEIAADIQLPNSGKTIGELLAVCADPLPVKLYSTCAL